LGLVPSEERAFGVNAFRYLHEVAPSRDVGQDALSSYFASLKERLLDPDTIVRETPLGRVRRLAPAVTYSATPASWDDPILVPMGSSVPEWPGASARR
jgi:hypothetical protein